MSFRSTFAFFLTASVSLAHAGIGFGNASFEQPPIATNQWVANPTNASPWTFFLNGETKSGIANGNGSWGRGAHTGNQYAFLQSQATISQTVSGLIVGRTYKVNFRHARRNGGLGADVTNSIDLFAGSQRILANSEALDELWRPYESQRFVALSSSILFTFQGLRNEDRTSLFDDIEIVESDDEINPNNIRNGGFEEPGFQNQQWRYNPVGPVGVAWTFMAQQGSNRGSGIASNGSPWGGSAPEGDQFAFLQRDGFMEQWVTGLTVGEVYWVTFDQASRQVSRAHSVRIRIGDNEILTSTTSSTWSSKITRKFEATSSSMLLRFEGIDTGIDATSLIDNVQVVPEPATLLALTAGLATFLKRRSK